MLAREEARKFRLVLAKWAMNAFEHELDELRGGDLGLFAAAVVKFGKGGGGARWGRGTAVNGGGGGRRWRAGSNAVFFCRAAILVVEGGGRRLLLLRRVSRQCK